METTPGTPASPQPEETPSTVVETSATEATASEPAVVTDATKPATPAPEPSPFASAAAPAPAVAPEAPKPAPEPSPIASTVNVPADPGAKAAEGGEFQLLLDKLSGLLGDTDLNAVWQQSQRPLKLLGVAMVVIVALQLTSAVLDTLGGIPML
ncbi:MAG: CAAD domain-containing protein, partial [Synechococcus sp.]|nr:CAAD domain-containing protein [Synechococcus sp.]